MPEREGSRRADPPDPSPRLVETTELRVRVEQSGMFPRRLRRSRSQTSSSTALKEAGSQPIRVDAAATVSSDARPCLVELPGAHRVLDTASLTTLTVLLAECASVPAAAVGLVTAIAAGAAVRRGLTAR